jgi:amidase
MTEGEKQRGVCSRVGPLYNAEYPTAGFSSGSSNGSATATAASFGVFGMGEEATSSGRPPASNQVPVAYTPSRGLISIRGDWPLSPTCDTDVPHTRTVENVFALLNLVVASDEKTACDFWRKQPIVQLSAAESICPPSLTSISLTGK